MEKYKLLLIQKEKELLEDDKLLKRAIQKSLTGSYHLYDLKVAVLKAEIKLLKEFLQL